VYFYFLLFIRRIDIFFKGVYECFAFVIAKKRTGGQVGLGDVTPFDVWLKIEMI